MRTVKHRMIQQKHEIQKKYLYRQVFILLTAIVSSKIFYQALVLGDSQRQLEGLKRGLEKWESLRGKWKGY